MHNSEMIEVTKVNASREQELALYLFPFRFGVLSDLQGKMQELDKIDFTASKMQNKIGFMLINLLFPKHQQKTSSAASS